VQSNITGVVEPIRWFSYFPVIVNRNHLRLLREYLERKHRMPFNDVFHKMLKFDSANNQFDVMVCTYG
jgi:hypothetical protein